MTLSREREVMATLGLMRMLETEVRFVEGMYEGMKGRYCFVLQSQRCSAGTTVWAREAFSAHSCLSW